MKPVRIAGVGCALLDVIFADVDYTTAAFRRFSSRRDGDGGLAPGKLVFLRDLERFAGVPFASILRDIAGDREPTAENLGGPAIVALIHAAQVLENAVVRFYGSRGDDATADDIGAIVAKTPLVVEDYRCYPGRTPSTFVLSDPTYDDGRGERCFVNDLGTAADFSPADLDAAFFAHDVLVFGGTALVPTIHDSLDELLARAWFGIAAPGRNAGADVGGWSDSEFAAAVARRVSAGDRPLCVVNTVFDFRNEQRNPGRPWPLTASPRNAHLIDLLIADEEEARKLTGRPNAASAAQALCDRGVGAVIVTRGAEPTLVQSRSPLFKPIPGRCFPICEQVAADIAAGRTTRGDTTGCGDNFAGGVIAAIAEQLQRGTAPFDLDVAARAGTVAGGFACFYTGGTFIEHQPGAKKQGLAAYEQAYARQLATIAPPATASPPATSAPPATASPPAPAGSPSPINAEPAADAGGPHA